MMTDTWTWATVTQASPLRIKVDGDTSALDATTGDLVGSLAVDDRVRVHLHSDGIIATGVQGGNEKVHMVAHPESDPPGAYPVGITVSDTSAGGWPSDFATIVTNAVSAHRTSQVLYEKDVPARQWWRTGIGLTWTAWKEVATVGRLGQTLHTSGLASGSTTALNTTAADIPGATTGAVALLAGDVVFLTGAFDITGGPGIFIGSILANGNSLPGDAHGQEVGRRTQYQQWRYVVASDGTYTFKLSGRTTSDTTTSYGPHTNLMWQVFR